MINQALIKKVVRKHHKAVLHKGNIKVLHQEHHNLRRVVRVLRKALLKEIHKAVPQELCEGLQALLLKELLIKEEIKGKEKVILKV